MPGDHEPTKIEISLEPLRPEHANEMLEGLSAPEGYRFLPDHPPASANDLREKYVRQARGGSADGAEIWCNWIIRDRQTTEAMGYTQATIRDHSALIAYHLFTRFWRSGIGTNAVYATLSILFEMMDVNRAFALVDTRNAGSMALLRKLGFSSIRRHVGADFFKGTTNDEFEFELRLAAWNDR